MYTSMKCLRRLWAVFTAIACISGGTPLPAQSDGAIVTRRGAKVHGTVWGNVLALDESASVTIAPEAMVSGDITLPAASKPVKSPASSGPAKDKTKPSPAARLEINRGGNVKGRQRVAKGFALPDSVKSKFPHGTRTIVLESGREPDPSFADVRDFTLRRVQQDLDLPPRTIALPPGNYGNVIVEDGQIVLGAFGAKNPVQYSIESLTVGKGGGLELLSPVVLLVDRLEAIQGRIGNRRYTQWLDLRVSGGDIDVGTGSEVHGVVTAPASSVTLRRGAMLRGGLVCDHATVDPDAEFVGVQPSWAPEATGNAKPLFIHRAVRMNQSLADLSADWPDGLTADVSYPGDQPWLQLDEGRAKISAKEQHRVLFDACIALFGASRFPQGRLTIKSGRSSLDVLLTCEGFEAAVLSVGKIGAIAEGIPIIREDPEKLASMAELLISNAATPTS